jgi:DNA primase
MDFIFSLSTSRGDVIEFANRVARDAAIKKRNT